MIKIINPFTRRKLNKKLDISRTVHIESLPGKSFSKKLLTQFKSHKDMNKEKRLLRFSEDKSIHDISNRRRKHSVDGNLGLAVAIAENRGYNLKKATNMHIHHNSEKIRCLPSIADIKSYFEDYDRIRTKKFMISFLDDNNIKEIGRLHLIIKPRVINEIDESGKSLEKIFKHYMPLKELNQYNYTDFMVMCEQIFDIKYVGLNGYKFDPKTYKFGK